MFKNNVQSIVAPLAKIKSDLVEYVKRQEAIKLQNLDRITLLNKDNSDIVLEQDKAKVVLDNLGKLLGV